MSTFSVLLAIGFIGLFIGCILFVVFGQITVRKLRKNPETKEHLGMEFTSGWDILNVAGALSTPLWLRNKFENSPLKFMSARYEVIYNHTSIFDRILGRTFWFFYMSSGLLIIALVFLEGLGIIEG
jgi:hypothetical protein